MISIKIPNYENIDYLKPCIESVLKAVEFIDNYNIEIVDDCSKKANVRELLKIYGFEKKVSLFVQNTNKGVSKNLNTCISRAKGDLVHILHSDDLVSPDFYKLMIPVFDKYTNIGACFSRSQFVNEFNEPLYQSPHLSNRIEIIDDFHKIICRHQVIQTPSVIVRKKVYNEIGGFDTTYTSCEDWDMWARIAHKYEVAHIPIPLCQYRVHKDSNTFEHRLNGKELSDIVKTIERNCNSLDKSIASRVRDDAINSYSKISLVTMKSAFEAREYGSIIETSKTIINKASSKKMIFFGIWCIVKCFFYRLLLP